MSIEKQMKESAQAQAEAQSEQSARQERLELDRIRELRQLEEYRQREKLLDLIPGYRQQQALELAEQMRLEKEEEARLERQYRKEDRKEAKIIARLAKDQEEKRMREVEACEKNAEKTMNIAKKNPIGIFIILVFVLAAVFLCYDNGFIAISLAILATVGATVTNVMLFGKNRP